MRVAGRFVPQRKSGEGFDHCSLQAQFGLVGGRKRILLAKRCTRIGGESSLAYAPEQILAGGLETLFLLPPARPSYQIQYAKLQYKFETIVSEAHPPTPTLGCEMLHCVSYHRLCSGSYREL